MSFSIDPEQKYYVAIDLAKYNFQVCVETEEGKQIRNKLMKRDSMMDLLLNLPSGTPVAMEACGTSNFWGRFCQRIGLEPCLINPVRVKPFRSGKNKNDANDAEAIMEASRAKHTHFIKVKTVLDSTIANIIEMRRLEMTFRISKINQLRAIIGEHGIAIKQNPKALLDGIDKLLEEYENGKYHEEFLPQLIDFIKKEKDKILGYDKNIKEYNDEIKKYVNNSVQGERLSALPGWGPLTVAEFICRVGDGSQFKNGRLVAASIGLTPSEHSSGGKQSLGGITHRGNITLRTLMVNGAIAAIRGLQQRLSAHWQTMKFGQLDLWVKKLLETKSKLKVAVALANKLARIAWRISAYGVEFDTNKACGLCAGQEAQNAM